MKAIQMTVLSSMLSAGVLLGCASRGSAPVETPAETIRTPTLYLAAEKSAPTTKPTAWLSGAAPQSGNHLQEAKPAPAQGQLPAGHPPIPGAQAGNAAAQGQGQLPAGHPDISQMKGGAGGAGTAGGMGAMKGQLPAGHPSVEQMQAAPATQPVTFGTLTVKAIQKTANGPAISGDDVTVEIYDQENMIKKVQAKLDESGVAKVADVPFGGTYGQFVRINHGGVEYTQQVDAGQEVAVNVHESTEAAPAWSIKMRHMIVQPLEEGGGVQVTDVLAVENPSDRAWLGRDEGSGKRTTFAVGLPAGATNVQLGGAFHDCCVKIENGKAVNTMALLPGVNKYQISYTLSAVGGKAEVSTSAPALTKNMIVMVPDDGAAASAVGLEGPSTVNMGGGNTRFFRGTEVKEGTDMKVTLAVAGSGAAKSAATKSTSSINASQMGRIIAGAGGLLIFVIGGMFMFLKAPKTGKRSR